MTLSVDLLLHKNVLIIFSFGPLLQSTFFGLSKIAVAAELDIFVVLLGSCMLLFISCGTVFAILAPALRLLVLLASTAQ